MKFTIRFCLILYNAVKISLLWFSFSLCRYLVLCRSSLLFCLLWLEILDIKLAFVKIYKFSQYYYYCESTV